VQGGPVGVADVQNPLKGVFKSRREVAAMAKPAPSSPYVAMTRDVLLAWLAVSTTPASVGQ